jgi:ABC-type multidrug transport system ATPase subunit
VTKRFTRRGAWILNGIDLEMESGSRTLIVGGNGSGKSTLLRIIAKLAQPTSGVVVSPSTIGYVPERLAARNWLTGAQYVAHMGRIKGLDAKVIEARRRELFERLNLQPSPLVSSGSLSKGNRQKLAIAQAFLGPVQMLVLDEPYTGLDATAQRALSELIEEAQALGTSVLESAHRADLALGSNVSLRLEGGRLTQIPPNEVSQNSNDRAVNSVVLVAAKASCKSDQIVQLVGIRSSDYDGLQRTLVLVIDRSKSDDILSRALALGWSVTSVSPHHEELPPE